MNLIPVNPISGGITIVNFDHVREISDVPHPTKVDMCRQLVFAGKQGNDLKVKDTLTDILQKLQSNESCMAHLRA